MSKTIKLISIYLLIGTTFSLNAENIKNFVFFGLSREKISAPEFINNNHFTGAQLKYTWKELEPAKDKYNFNDIESDLNYLQAHNKKLFIQLQDSTFSPKRNFVPRYIINNKKYHGGAVYQYILDKDDNAVKPEGWVAMRWDKNVAERFHKLLSELGKKFNGKVEGINLPETSIGVTEKPKDRPFGFSYKKYENAIIENMLAAKKAFPDSKVIQYLNFMPGEFLPWTDNSHLRNIYKFAEKNNIGVGTPDIFPYQKWHMANCYNFIHNMKKRVPVGIAAQDGNYSYINPKTKKQVTIQQMYQFAKNYLHAGYIFWCTEKPYFKRDVIPFINNLKQHIKP